MAIFANPPPPTRNTCPSSVHDKSNVLADTTNLRPTISAPKALGSFPSSPSKLAHIHAPTPVSAAAPRSVLTKKPSAPQQQRQPRPRTNKPLPARPPLSTKAAPTCTVSLTSATASLCPETETLKAIPFPSSHPAPAPRRASIDARSLMRPTSPTPPRHQQHPPRPCSPTPPAHVHRRRRRSSAASTLSQVSTTSNSAPARKKPKLSRVPPVSHSGRGEALSPLTEEKEEDAMSTTMEVVDLSVPMLEKDGEEKFKCLGKLAGQDMLSQQSAMLAQKVREKMGEVTPSEKPPTRPPSPPVTPRMQNAIATLLLEHGNSYRYGPRIVKLERRPPSPLREVAFSPIFVFDDTDGDGKWIAFDQAL